MKKLKTGITLIVLGNVLYVSKDFFAGILPTSFGDFTEGFRHILQTVDITRLDEPAEIFNAYQYAYERKDNRSTIIVEYGDYYNEK